MLDESKLIDSIYEAAVVANRWPSLLEAVGRQADARGGLIYTVNAGQARWLGGGEAAEMAVDFERHGWVPRNNRPALLLGRMHPGFVTETDVASEEFWAEQPMFTEFLLPRGYVAAAGTVITGLGEDHVFVSIEGFRSHGQARAAIPHLDKLRPHFARAGQISSQLGLERLRGYVEALEAIGAAAGVLNTAGVLRLANQKLQEELGRAVLESRTRLRLSDVTADRLLEQSINALRAGLGGGRSIVLRDPRGMARVLHVLPVRGQAHDLFIGSSAIVVVTNPNRILAIDKTVLQNLFDLTPAEARLAARVCTGNFALQAIASEFGVSINTVRTQLQALFDKTGTARQADLARLLIAANTF